MDWGLVPAAIQIGAVVVQLLGDFRLKTLAKIDIGLGVVCLTASYAFFRYDMPGSAMVQAGCGTAYWITAVWLLLRIRQRERFEAILAEGERLVAELRARNAAVHAHHRQEGSEPRDVRAGEWAPPARPRRGGSVPSVKQKPPAD